MERKKYYSQKMCLYKINKNPVYVNTQSDSQSAGVAPPPSPPPTGHRRDNCRGHLHMRTRLSLFLRIC